MKHKVRFWNSIITKAGLFFIGLVILSILISGYLVYLQSSSVITDHSKERLEYINDLASRSFHATLDQVTHDIAWLAQNPVLENFIENPNVENNTELSELFKSTLVNKPAYFQLRLISAEDYGKEIIRFDKLNDVVSEVRPESLQYKDDREYFIESISLAGGDYYFSQINLNEEHGRVDLPHTPTLRAASPVFYNNGDTKGILIINVNLSELFDEFDNLMEPGIQLYLIDENGQYLFAPDRSITFNRQLEHDHTFESDFGIPWTSLIKTRGTDIELSHNGEKFLFNTHPIRYFNGRRSINLLSMIERSHVLASAEEVRSDAIRTVLIICFISLLLILLFTHFFSRRITKMTQTVLNYNSDPVQNDLHLPDTGKDELGVLAGTFNSMNRKIQQQVKDLNLALSKEQQAIRERDEFLQNMSHELRTPLNAIVGISQLLRKNNPTQSQLPIIHSLERSAKNLESLMYDILDHKKLKEGKATIHYSPTNIDKVLQDIHASYRFDALNKKIGFELVVEKTLKTQQFQCDAIRLTQIVTNLVMNAIKFTNEGKVSIIAKLIESEKAPHLLRVEVKDTGIGVAPEAIDKINQRSFQISTDTDKYHTGFGLGLSIVTHLVNLFKGELQVKSKPGKGSTFTVQIPVQSAGKNKKILKQNGSNRYPQLSSPLQVVHIEDDESSRLLVRHALDELPIVLQQFDNWTDAQEKITRDIQLVISDLMLDKENIGEQLVLITENNDVPVLILSAFDHNFVSEISPYYLQKPFNLDALCDEVIRTACQRMFNPPQLEKVYAQYDHDSKKIKNYLNILIREFNEYTRRIEATYVSRDQPEWEAIVHKLIAHTKSMRLNTLNHRLPTKIADLSKSEFDYIVNSLLYCQSYFRCEVRQLAQ